MKTLMKKYKRGLAGFLAFCVMITSVNTAAWASEGIPPGSIRADIQMHLDANQLQEAALEAIVNGSADEILSITPEALGLTDLEEDGVLKKYEKLFSENEKGRLYEVFPEILEENIIPDFVSLRMFIRAKASENYSLSGKEEVVFLFTNKAEETLTFQVWVDENYLPVVSVKANSNEAVDMEGTLPAPTEESAEQPTESLPGESESVGVEQETTKAEEVAEAEEVTEAEQETTKAEETAKAEEATEAKTDAVTPEETAAEEIEAADVVEAAPAEDNSNNDNDSSDEGEVSISSLTIPMVATSDEVYYEDTDLIDDGGKGGSSVKKYEKTEEAVEEAEVVKYEELVAAEPVARKPVKIEGKLLDELSFTEASEGTVRAYVTSLDKILAVGKGEIVKKPVASPSVATASNATLVVKHGYPGEGGRYIFQEETITTLISGTTVVASDVKADGEYSKYYSVEKSEPAELILEQGTNEINIYYSFQMDSTATLNYGNLERLSGVGRRGRSTVGLPQGEVGASKTAAWTKSEGNEYAAEIELSVVGEPVKTPVDVILVLDGSGSMINPKQGGVFDEDKKITRLSVAEAAAKSFAKTILDRNVGLGADQEVLKNRVGVVGFNTGVTVSQPLTTSAANAEASITRYSNSVWIGNGTNYTNAFRGAEALLKGSNSDNGRKTFILFMTDGRPEDENRAEVNAMRNFVKQLDMSDNVSVFTVGIGLDKLAYDDYFEYDPDVLLKYLASTSEQFFNVKNDDIQSTLETLFQKIASQTLMAGTDAVIIDKIHPNYKVDTSKLPSGLTYDPEDHSVTWRIGNILKDVKSIKIPIILNPVDGSYNTEITYPTNEGVILSYTDAKGETPTKKDFGKPELALKAGLLTIRYCLANEQGDYLNSVGEPMPEGTPSSFRTVIKEDRKTVGTLDQNFEYTPDADFADDNGKIYITLNKDTIDAGKFAEGETRQIDIPVYTVTDYPYTVNFYKDAASGTPLKTITGKGKTGVGIMTVSGAGIDDHKPAGDTYKNQPVITYPNDGDGNITKDVNKNIINITYVKKTEIQITGPSKEINFGTTAPEFKDLSFTLTSGTLEIGDTITMLATSYNDDTTNANDHLLEENRTKILGSVSIKRNGVDVSETDYIVTIVPGTLTIKKLPNNLTAEPKTAIYDGKAHTIDTTKVSAEAGSKLQYSTDGTTWTDSLATFTNAGEYTIHIKATKENYQDATTTVQVKIEPRPVTLQAESIERPYKGDGDTLSLEEEIKKYTTTIDENNPYDLAEGQEISSIAHSGEATEIDTTVASNVSNAVVIDSVTKDPINANNYIFTYKPGTLKLTKGITNNVELKGFEGTYDGQFHGVERIVTAPDMVSGSTIHYTWTENGETQNSTTPPTFKDAGTYSISYYTTHPDYENTVPKTVEVKITQRDVTIRGKHPVYTYDGQSRSALVDDYTVDAPAENTGIVTGNKERVSLSGMLDGRKAETTSIEIGEVKIFDGTDDLTRNYNIIKVAGSLTIKQGSELSISAIAPDATYDGLLHGITDYTVIGTNNVEVTNAKIEYSLDGEKWQGDPFKFANANSDDKPTYKIHIRATHDGYSNTATTKVEFRINKFPLTITSLDFAWSYDGKAHGHNQYVSSVDEVAVGQKLYIGFSTSVTDVTPEGGTDNEFLVEVIGTDDTIDQNPTKYTDNYQITSVYGKLHITPVVNRLTVLAVNKEYDKTAAALSPTAAGDSTFKYSLDGGKSEVSAPSYTDVTTGLEGVTIIDGAIQVWVKAVNSNYIDTDWVQTSIKIYPRKLTVKPDDKTVPYTGTKPNGFTGNITHGTVVPGDNLNFTYDVAATYKGSYQAGESISIEASYANNKNYDVTSETGTLTIGKSTDKLTVTAEPYVGTYNGKMEHGLDSRKVTGSVSEGTTFKYATSKDADALWLDTPPMFKDAGKYAVYVKAYHNNYDDSVIIETTVTIEAKKIILKPDSVSKVYGEIDPEPFTGSAYDEDTNQSMNLYGNDDLKVVYGRDPDYAKVENAGPNVVKLIVQSYDKENKNYAVSIKENWMSITKADKPEISVDDTQATYNGEKHTVNDISTITGVPNDYLNLPDTTIEYTYTDKDGVPHTSKDKPEFTEAGTYEVTVTVKNPNYEDASTTTNVIIDKKAITVKPEDVTGVYNGIEYKPTGIKAGEGELVGTQQFGDSYTLSGGQTNQGTGSSQVVKDSIVIVDEAGAVKTNNYQITVESGTITVTAAPITIIAEDISFAYNGQTHHYSGAKVNNAEGKDIADVTIEYSVDGTTWSKDSIDAFENVVPNAGTYNLMIRANNESANANYATAAKNIKVTVNPERITITVDAKSKIYQTTDPVFTGSTTVGQIYNEVDKTALNILYNRGEGSTVENVGADITITATHTPNDNYVVTVIPNKLTITASGSNNVNFDSVTQTYDGNSYGLNNVVATHPEGSIIKYSTTPEVESSWNTNPITFENAGTYKVYLRVENPNFETVGKDNQISGTVTINKKPVVITVESTTKIYGDKDPVPNTTLDTALVTEGDLGAIKVSRVTPVADDTKDTAGSKIEFKAEYTSNNNYDVTVNNGNVTVLPKAGTLQIIAESDVAIYTGTEHAYKGATASITDGSTIEYSVDGDNWSTEVPKFTDVAGIGEDGTVEDYPIYIRVTNPNYEVPAPVIVTMTIAPAKAHIIVGDYTKVYGEGDPVYDKSTVSGIVDSVGLGTISYSREDAENPNENTTGDTPIAINPAYTVNKNYAVTFTPGSLKITPAGIPLNVSSVKALYDGEAHEIVVSGVEAIEPNLSYVLGRMDSEEIPTEGWSTTHPTLTEFGTYRVFVRAEKENYTVDVKFADVSIAKRPVFIKVKDATKPYDGTALTSDEIEIRTADSTSGLVKDQQIIAHKTQGTITNVGSTDNLLLNGDVYIEINGEVKTSNYEIQSEPGKLIITKAPAEKNIILDATDKSWEFNHEAHQYPSATATGINENDSIKIEYSIDGGITWLPKAPNDFVNVKDGGYEVFIRASGDNFDGYVETSRTVTITPKEVTINVDNASKNYTSADPEFKGNVTGLVESDNIGIGTVTYTRHGDHTDHENVGDNIQLVPSYTENPNYNVIVKPGTLTITTIDDNRVNVEGNSGIYNGEEFGLKSVTPKHEGSTIWYATSPDAPEREWTRELPKYTEAGIYDVYVKVTHNSYNDYVTSGTITIEARPIVIKADSAQKLFDNTTLVKDSATITSELKLVAGHTLSEVRVEGSQRAVGSSTNKAYNAVIRVENTNARALADVTHNYSITYEDGILEILDNPHTLTINYVYHAGEEGDAAALPPTYQTSHGHDTVYTVSTKEIPDYVADKKFVVGVMKFDHISVVVTYHKDANGNGIPDSEEDRFTITFQPGTNGTLEGTAEFKNILTGTVFGQAVTVPTPVASGRYRFDGWKDVSDSTKTIPGADSLITESKTYEAQWIYVSSGGGGGGGGSTPGGSGGGNPDSGPGVPNDTTTTIQPDDIPLAALPPILPDGNNLTIDDGEIPLASLPKTGERSGAVQLAILFSGLLAGLFVTLTKKRDEGNN